MSGIRRLLPLVLLITAGLILLASGLPEFLRPEALVANHARLRALVDRDPVLTYALHVAALTAMVATAMPGAVLLVLAGGMLFGPLGGGVSAMLGATLGSLSLFLASRRAFVAGQRQAPALVERLRVRYHDHPWSYTMFLRLVPVLPFGAVTLALAWLRCPLHLFIAATMAGSALMASLQATIGAHLVELVARDGGWSTRALFKPGIVLPTTLLALLTLAPLLLEHIRGRNRNGR